MCTVSVPFSQADSVSAKSILFKRKKEKKEKEKNFLWVSCESYYDLIHYEIKATPKNQSKINPSVSWGSAEIDW